MLIDNPDLVEAKRVVIPLENNGETAHENKTEPEYFNDESPQRIFENWQRLEGFETSIELLAFFDTQINNGTVVLHPWQVDTGETLCTTGENGYIQGNLGLSK